jgi:dihydroorotase
MLKQILLRNGTLVMPHEVVRGDILLEGDRIAALGHVIEPEGAQIVDISGCMVAPGLCDFGVFAVEKAACIAGGITRVMLMPDQAQVLDNPGLVQLAALAAKPDLWVHPLAAATKDLGGSEIAEYGLMKRAGARGISTGRRWIADSGVMLRVLTYAKAHDLTVISHAEDAGLTRNAVASAGAIATTLGLPAAPVEAEAMAIARDIALVRLSHARLYIRQVTTKAGIELIIQAKAQGLPISCGVSFPHLLCDESAIAGYQSFAKLSPPLRSAEDREALCEALKAGHIDILCSGHDPQGPEAKRLPFIHAASGVSGAETMLALGLHLVALGHMSLPQFFTYASRNPACLCGLPAGQLALGAPADLVVFNRQESWRIEGAAFKSAAGNTLFEGMDVQGKVRHTIKGGAFLSL